MRGAAVGQLGDDVQLGIIPAHAGSSQSRRTRASGSWDHPRACGEQVEPQARTPVRVGSSPRMRGAVHLPYQENVNCGIIPAHAGSRVKNAVSSFWKRDHPRACGEQPMRALAAPSMRGSSPRMRGAVRDCIPGLRRQGIIPAHAGSRSGTRRWGCRPRDHPRACGEQIVSSSPSRLPPGSSPRMRGAGAARTSRRG